MTNFEKIKQMSIEEMARTLTESVRCCECDWLGFCADDIFVKCTALTMEWLNKEAE